MKIRALTLILLLATILDANAQNGIAGNWIIHYTMIGREVEQSILLAMLTPNVLPLGCAPADLDEDLQVDVNIEVRTASFMNGIPAVDPNLYFSADGREPGFFSTGGVIRNGTRNRWL